jgi:hypothetical protein
LQGVLGSFKDEENASLPPRVAAGVSVKGDRALIWGKKVSSVEASMHLEHNQQGLVPRRLQFSKRTYLWTRYDIDSTDECSMAVLV